MSLYQFYNLDGNQIRLDQVGVVTKIFEEKSSKRNEDDNGWTITSNFYFKVGIGNQVVNINRSKQENADEIIALRSSLLRALTIDEPGMNKPSTGESVSGYRKVEEPTTDPTGNPTPNIPAS